MTRTLLATLSLLAILMTASATPSLAKKVSNQSASNLMSICLLNGGRTSEPNNGEYVKCCTSKGDFCIICRQNGSGQCNKTDYRPLRTSNDPGTQAPASGVVAPANPDKNKSNAKDTQILKRK